jgi:type IV secretion system protein VirB10
MSDYEDDLDDLNEPQPLWTRTWVRAVAVVAAVAIVWVVTRPKPPGQETGTTGASAETFIGAVVPYQPYESVAAAEPVKPPPPPPPPALPAAWTPMAPAAAPPPPPPPPPPPAIRTLMPPMPGGLGRPASLAYGPPHMEAPKPAAQPPAPPERTSLGFKTAMLPGVKASPAIDDTYQLMPGLLPCVLDTAIKSDLPGPLLCHLPGPVYSPKGVLLMEAGTPVIGKYETMARNSGNRLLATSAYAHTPNGIWVPLAGEPLADSLGRAGLDGAVDNHYFQRFGAAVILNLTEAALGIVQAEVSKGGNTYLQLNGGGGVGGLAQTILQSTINMPATFSKNQGEIVAIFLDQPIDFSDSYRIRETRGQ